MKWPYFHIKFINIDDELYCYSNKFPNYLKSASLAGIFSHVNHPYYFHITYNFWYYLHGHERNLKI
jgi:hypothetical protein